MLYNCYVLHEGFVQNLESVYIEVLENREQISPNLAHILFQNELLYPYKNIKEFMSDVKDIVNAAKRDTINNIIHSSLPMEEKINYIQSFEAF